MIRGARSQFVTVHVRDGRVSLSAQPATVTPVLFVKALAALPPSHVSRWTRERRAAVGRAFKIGALTPEVAKQRYGLHLFELEQWSARYA